MVRTKRECYREENRRKKRTTVKRGGYREGDEEKEKKKRTRRKRKPISIKGEDRTENSMFLGMTVLREEVTGDSIK